MKSEFDVYKFITKLWKKLDTTPEAIIATLSALNFKRPDRPWAYGMTVRREYYISQGVKDFLDDHYAWKKEKTPTILKDIMREILG